MYDLEIVMDDRPGELARLGEILGGAGISTPRRAGGRGLDGEKRSIVIGPPAARR